MIFHRGIASCINLATITNTFVAKKIGQLSNALMHQADDCLRAALELQ